MANTFTPTTITNISGAEESALEAINNNFQEIKTALSESVAKSGGTVNTNLDINGQDVVNVDSLSASRILIGGNSLGIDASLAVNVPFTIRGEWLTSTIFSLNDLVNNNGGSYVCSSNHTSDSGTEPGVGGTWETNWDVVAEKGDTGATGASGAGSGDLISTNNLSDVASAASSLANLGGQPLHPNLISIAEETFSQGDVIYHDGSSLVNLGPGTAGQVLTTGGVDANPLWSNAGGIYLDAFPVSRSGSTRTNGTVLINIPNVQGQVGDAIFLAPSISITQPGWTGDNALDWRVEFQKNGIKIQDVFQVYTRTNTTPGSFRNYELKSIVTSLPYANGYQLTDSNVNTYSFKLVMVTAGSPTEYSQDLKIQYSLKGIVPLIQNPGTLIT